MPTPSDQPVPSAASAKDLLRPSGARPRWRLNSMKTPGVGEHGHAAGQGQRALAPAQGLGGQVHRHQRGGAGGVDGDRRALEAERVGDAAGDDAGRAPVTGTPPALVAA